MVIYNVTVKVEHSIAADWRYWMLQEHLPMLLKTGCFTDAKLFRLMDQDDTEGPTFCAQYYCNSREEYELYLEKYADAARDASQKLWGKKYIAFRSLMQLQD